jgi:hypothetical protein
LAAAAEMMAIKSCRPKYRRKICVKLVGSNYNAFGINRWMTTKKVQQSTILEAANKITDKLALSFE